MSYLLNPKKSSIESQQDNRLSEGSIYVREDDQDWGSSGMNDIQQDIENNQ